MLYFLLSQAPCESIPNLERKKEIQKGEVRHPRHLGVRAGVVLGGAGAEVEEKKSLLRQMKGKQGRIISSRSPYYPVLQQVTKPPRRSKFLLIHGSEISYTRHSIFSWWIWGSSCPVQGRLPCQTGPFYPRGTPSPPLSCDTERRQRRWEAIPSVKPGPHCHHLPPPEHAVRARGRGCTRAFCMKPS